MASREEALRTLAAIAEFFRRTEPLSPLSYTLQEAVRRARMSWPDLLEEIVPDAGQRSQILLSLGIRPPPSEVGGAPRPCLFRFGFCARSYRLGVR